ncbi:malate dehydrogenase (oxaloacetate-decarboxylating) [Clostridium tetanomorphum]|uniref:NADP-dependent malic enzyme n=1 Tax=Clostridium tetanomorphum TaxID=1553 RepID=A0A923E750_CLOTT|nr:NADP-dependent malic enzyme [Clostridium tetanomorphum]KAJ51766.1 malate dehydrogenase [Clostridium tetanomorphum DSM 665]MBC2397648.1 NADP-dependent malic enzyme [Clostridium tetanomorphum]MBP1865001.1 malate dehydrogenase (oxaloacetate-decarboxylating) [Clostridium tetanomorphum]NRS83402.1 malate dehydrogenase (oxaloacetate-decarboxylating) [Clostridium tetanomorphum]NRZ96601.1 malate dehydrogenase (oxaloacetate-decarboxylating) [Clostridium tetanomorphum]
MDYKEMSLKLHEEKEGKIEVISKVQVKDKNDLSTVYTPGVAEPCKKINQNREEVYRYTAKKNLVAVVTDGTAVLGLGDIGPEAAMPVMEGKSILFKEFGNVDAFPICLDTKDVNEIVKTIKYLSPTFGGINLEDIAAPRCFEIEKILKEELDIPVFHDDQHGTAIVVLAGILNALKLVNKKMDEAKIVINGAGAAGISICKLLLAGGAKNIVMCDLKGALAEGETWMNEAQEDIAKVTNRELERGKINNIIKGKDVFIGVSGPNVLTSEMVSTMNKDSIVFAMANPVPEILPEEAKAGGVRVVATGRSDYPNQINNVLVFPGIFRGALDARAKAITEEMKLAAAEAIASIVGEGELNEEYIIPDPFNKKVAQVVAKAVKDIAIKTGVSNLK